MRLPSNLGAALNVGYNDAMGFTEDPRIQQNIDRSQSLSQDALAMLGKLEGLRAPEPVRPAYRTEDLLGLLLGGVLSGGGREIPNLLAGFQQGKLGRAQQDTETNNQRFNQQADSIQRQGTILGQQAGIARQTANDLLGAQGRKQAIAERRRSDIEKAEIRRSELEEKTRKATFDGLIRQVNANMAIIRSGGPAERAGASQAIEDLVKKNPEYADQLLTYRDPLSFSQLTPAEALNVAKTETENMLREGRFNVLMAQANKLASGAEVDAARIEKLAEDTRLMDARVKNQTEALRIRAITGDAYAANVESLIKQRPLQFGLDLAKSTSSALAQQIAINKGALTTNGLLIEGAKKRMDAMKAQHGETSKQYLEAVGEFNVLNTTQGELEGTRNRLNNQVARVKKALLDTEAAEKANREARARGEYLAPRALPQIEGAVNALPGNVNFDRLKTPTPPPTTGGGKPKGTKAPPAKDAFNRLKKKLGPNWGVNKK